jgi:periplasmic protein TonB
MKVKIKVMKTRPEMTDDEIRAYMDFDRLLEMRKNAPSHRRFFRSGYILVVGIFLGVGVFSWVIVQQSGAPSEQLPNTNMENKGVPISDNKREDPTTDSSTNQSSNQPLTKNKPDQSPVTVSKDRQNSQAHKNINQPITPKSKKKDITQDQTLPEKPAVTAVYVQATPLDGYPNLYEYFNRELKYPQEAIKDSINGEVIAVFTINTQGLPEKIMLENSLGPLFDKEVVRLITNMPAWKPATYNNKPVASKMSLPLTFQIKKIPSQK